MKVTREPNDSVFVYYEPAELISKLKQNPLPGRSDASMDGDYSFTHTHSYDEAFKLLRYGDDESYELLKEVRKENNIDEMENSVRKRKKLVQDVAGFQPIVPNAILGLPKSMLNSNYDLSRKKIVRIYFDASVHAGIQARTMALAGAKIMSYIDTLEYNDYRVELYIGDTSYVRGANEVQGWGFPIKSSDQPLNIRKLSFYFINPSFLRRISFRVDEAEENLHDVTNSGYGAVDHTEERARMVFNALGDDINYYGLDVLNNKEFTTDLDEVKKQLGID